MNCSLNEINSLAVTQPPKRIIVGGRSLVFYDYDEPVDHHLADKDACLCVLYNPVFYTFITAHPTCVKIWDATNGCLQNVFRDISHADITCMCLDDRFRKLFVGDQRGRSYCLDVKNGVEKKRFKKPKDNKADRATTKRGRSGDQEEKDISSIIYWGTDDKNCLISASWDRNLYVFDDKDATAREGQWRYTLFGKNENSRLNYVDFWSDMKITATASDDGYVTVQNHQNQKFEGALCPFIDQPLPEVKVVKFLKPHNCLVSSDMDGYLNFYAIVPSPFKNLLLVRKRLLNHEM